MDQVPVANIPVVDLHKTDEEVAATVRHACCRYGFFYVTNHDVAEPLLDRVFQQSARFFALPMEKKLTCLANESNHGYTRMGEETLDPDNQTCGDTKEGYYVVLERPAMTEAELKDKPLSGPNVWPNEAELGLDGWRDTMLEYFGVMHSLGMRLTGHLALALGQPKNFFDGHFSDSMSALRLLHYNPTKSAPAEGVFACGEHTDYGMLTLLKTDSIPGLQVKPRGGDWIDVPPLPGAFIVNLGDMLQRWSNDLFCSTPHRVLNTTGQHRYSVPFFFEPDFDTMVKCIPSCCGADNPPKYPPIQSGTHLLNKYRQTHSEFKL